MRKSRFTETQIIGMIKEQEAGLTVAEVCRKHGIRWPTGECAAIADRQPRELLQAEGQVWRDGRIGYRRRLALHRASLPGSGLRANRERGKTAAKRLDLKL